MLDRAQQERAHLWPSFLPGGRRFVYLIQVGRGSGGGIHVGSLESSEKAKLLDTSVRASFVPPHHLMFVLDGTLMAQAHDLPDNPLTHRSLRADHPHCRSGKGHRLGRRHAGGEI